MSVRTPEAAVPERGTDVFSYGGRRGGNVQRVAGLRLCCALAGWAVLDDYGVGQDDAMQRNTARIALDYI